jgi:hypothetical protein
MVKVRKRPNFVKSALQLKRETKPKQVHRGGRKGSYSHQGLEVIALMLAKLPAAAWLNQLHFAALFSKSRAEIAVSRHQRHQFHLFPNAI